MVCVGDSQPSCHPTQVVAVVPGRALHLSPTPDGRLLFVEAGRRVRVFGTGGLIELPALEVGRSADRIVGLAVDHAFEQTRSVFVAWTRRVTSGEETLSVTRYRELQGVLAQGATIVTGLPLRAGAEAPLVVDGSGLVYVALPSNGNDPRPGTGLVLRYTRDGLTPSQNLRASPVMAYGFSRPTGLAYEESLGRIWLSGESTGWGGGVAALPVSRPSGNYGAWPLSPQVFPVVPTDAGSPARRFLLKDSRLVQANWTAALGDRLAPVALNPELPVQGVVAAGAAHYVSVGAGEESQLLHLSIP
jgi:glucose/arabinose dehydrogenase